MRKCIWSIFILLCISCANKNKEMNAEADVVLKRNMEYLKIEEREVSLENLTTQKLNEYFELLQLNNEHPEFNEDIQQQLNTLSKQSLFKVGDLTPISIKNIHQIGNVEKVSDSVQKIKLLYTVTFGSREITDSIYASIFFKTIQIEEVETLSSKVIFSKIK